MAIARWRSVRGRLTIMILSLCSLVLAERVARADNWGCDMVNSNTGIGAVDDCGMQGACCDAHDDGYRAYDCGASSWFHTMCASFGTYCGSATACDIVNQTAVICIASQSPGPGLCCNLNGHNVCQQPRNPDQYWGCSSDAFCDAGSRCDLTTGGCNAICINTVPTQCDVGWTDSCGNTYAPVGCRDGLQCVSGQCRTCQTCDAHPGQCGIFDDGCGREIACGCSPPLTCDNGSCAPMCNPYTCADYGYAGFFDDGCGGYLSCDDPDPGPWDPGDDPGPGTDPGGGGDDDCWDCIDPSDPDWCSPECVEEE